MLTSSDLQSMIRSLLLVLGTLGVVHFSAGANIDTWSTAIATILFPALAWAWSRKNRKDLLFTDPETGKKIAPVLLLGLLLLPLIGGGLGGCAATVGSNWQQTHDKIAIGNGSPNTTTASISNGDKFASNGTGPASLTLATSDESRSWASGATPTNLHTSRKPDGTTSFSFFGAADRSIEAGKLTYDPATGQFVGEDVKIGGGAAEATRAANEALIPLVGYWQSRDAASRDVLIEQIKTTGQIPKDLAPFIVQLLLGL